MNAILLIMSEESKIKIQQIVCAPRTVKATKILSTGTFSL